MYLFFGELQSTDLTDTAICDASTQVARNLAKTYISSDLNCREDKDCSEVYYLGGSVCGTRMVNAKGAAGHKLLLENGEYQKMVSLEKDASDQGMCGPRPLCSPRPAGKIKCLSVDNSSWNKKCSFQLVEPN